MRFFSILLFCCGFLAAQTQHFSFGVTGGVPLLAPIPNSALAADESRRYTVGPTVEASLTEHISLGVSLLYKRTGYRYSYSLGRNLLVPEGTEQLVRSEGNLRSNSLELPVIGKYTFRRASAGWRPFAGAGFAFKSGWDTQRTRSVLSVVETGSSRVLESESSRRSPFNTGAVFSAGLNLRRGRVQYVPEFRFTRWGSFGTNHRQSQAEALFSIRF